MTKCYVLHAESHGPWLVPPPRATTGLLSRDGSRWLRIDSHLELKEHWFQCRWCSDVVKARIDTLSA